MTTTPALHDLESLHGTLPTPNSTGETDARLKEQSIYLFIGEALTILARADEPRTVAAIIARDLASLPTGAVPTVTTALAYCLEHLLHVEHAHQHQPRLGRMLQDAEKRGILTRDQSDAAYGWLAELQWAGLDPLLVARPVATHRQNTAVAVTLLVVGGMLLRGLPDPYATVDRWLRGTPSAG